MGERRHLVCDYDIADIIFLIFLVAWLDNKLISSKFAFPGVYWPASQIPLEIWKTSPATTNGNEQAHRNVNRDGIGLTLLVGVMRGMHFDKRAYQGIEDTFQTGVRMRDEIATHHTRKKRTISRKGLLSTAL